MFRVIKLNSSLCDGSLLCRCAKAFMVKRCNKYSVLTSNPAQGIVFQQLTSRSLVRVAGRDASDFLQGLITNDMRHFEDSKKGSMYAMMLNQQGRVLYDIIIYALRAENGELSYLMECDATVLIEICIHLKMYRVRKKVDVTPMDGQLSVWNISKRPESLQIEEIAAPEKQVALPADHQSSHQGGRFDEINIEVKVDSELVHAHARDPRLASLGWRLILSEGTAPKDVVNENVDSSKEEYYRALLYRLGIGEGVSDLPPANCLPLECNVDYLHGVSFHKGCYVGQELTARTYHTGVVRKRLLPMVFEGTDTSRELDPKESTVVNEDNKNVGKFRGHRGTFGLGLLRIQECLNSKKKLRLQGLQSSIGFTTFRPFWWPNEAPKESHSVTKTP